MKTAISIPQGVFETAEKYCAENHMSRSKLYTKAIQAYLDGLKAEEITRNLNEVYKNEDSRLDPRVRKAQGRSLRIEKW